MNTMPHEFHHCSVSDCINGDQNSCNTTRKENNANNVTFHDLPDDDIVSKQWLKNIHRNNWLLSSKPKICSLHFSEECFNVKSGQLKKGSVPTIFPELSDRKNHIGLYSRCIVATCRKSSSARSSVKTKDYVTLHSLPILDHEKLKQWIAALRLDPALIETATRDVVVCSDHFAKKDFKYSYTRENQRDLKDDAVPFLIPEPQLDDDDIDIVASDIQAPKSTRTPRSFQTPCNKAPAFLKECRIYLSRCDNLIPKKVSVVNIKKEAIESCNMAPTETSKKCEPSADPLWPSRASMSTRSSSEEITSNIAVESGLNDEDGTPICDPPTSTVPVSLPVNKGDSIMNGLQSEMQYTVFSTCLNMLYVRCEQCKELVAMSKGNSNYDGSTLAVRCICSQGHHTIWYSQPQVQTPGLCNWVSSNCEGMELMPDACVELITE